MKFNEKKAPHTGINPNFLSKKSKFQPATWEVIETLSNYWYVSNGGQIPIAHSYYDTIFLKPTEETKEKFNIEREVIVIFSNYPSFQPRCFDAIDKVRSSYQKLRFEEICSIMISADNNVEEKVKNFLKSNQESQIIIPFSYKEIRKLKKKDAK